LKEIALIRRQSPLDGNDDFPLVLDVVGPITHRTALALRDALRDIGPPSAMGHLEIHLDLTRCPQIDVDGLLALKVSQNEARKHGGDLHLIHVPLPIARQIRQHNFDDLLGDTTREGNQG
jgi:ABC-type transporter Mla MlaB component